MIREMWEGGWAGRSLLAIFASIIPLISLIIWAGLQSDRAWALFKIEHNCRIVGKMSGDVITSFGPVTGGGVAMSVGATPGKTGWQCDDGMTYWR